jgi:MFS family permease
MRAGTEGKAQGFMATAHHLGFFVGPPLGGLIIDALDWRWIFYFMVPFGIAGIFLTYTRFAVPARGASPPHPKRPAVDYPGTVLFVFMAGVLTLMLDHRAAQALGIENRHLLFLAFGGALVGFLLHEKRSRSPMMNLSLFKIRTFTIGILGLTAATMTHGLIGLIMPFYLQDVLRIAPSFIGLIFLLPSIFTITLATPSGNLTDRRGPRMPLITGAIALIVTFILGYHLETDSHWAFPTLVLGLTGIAGAFFNIPVQTAIIGAVPKEHRGFAAGIIHTIFGLGHLLGISAAKLILALAFESYSGIPGAVPTAENPAAFVFAMSMTYVAGLAASAIALVTALLIRNES